MSSLASLNNQLENCILRYSEMQKQLNDLVTELVGYPPVPDMRRVTMDTAEPTPSAMLDQLQHKLEAMSEIENTFRIELVRLHEAVRGTAAPETASKAAMSTRGAY